VACILCIDDDRDVLKPLAEALHTSGYSTLTALSGNQGLRLLFQNSVDLVVLDYEMPGINGELVAQAVHRSKPEVPIPHLKGRPDDIPGGAQKRQWCRFQN
jgi:DNA-binding response OmpR family regulator